MNTKNILLTILVLISSTSDACMTGSGKLLNPSEMQKHFKKSSRNPASLIKFAEGHPSPSLESLLGNLLLEYRPQKAGEKIVLSIPARIERGTFNPFGDGQINAKMNFGPHWKSSKFPVIGVQKISSNGISERKYVFDPNFQIKDYSETKLNSEWFKVQPKGWSDSFYFSFESNALTVSKFLEGVPVKNRTFIGNRVAPNPAGIERGIGSQGIENKDLGEGYNKDGWWSDNVHGLYPNKDGHKTALGGVLTWGLVDGSHQGSFKHLYTCFEPRNLSKEKEHGVPYGAGWHFIGDAAESILNTLEKLPLPVAVGRTHGFEKSAYELTETITATWLLPDEVLVTQNKDFHWYLNPYESDVCTEIWVHNCIPDLSNSWGFNCPWKK